MNSSLANLSIQDNRSSVSSIELAALIGKQHGHIMRDIRKMLKDLGDGTNRYTSGTYEDSQGKQRPFYTLDKTLTLTLITSYAHEVRFKVFDKLNILNVMELLSNIDASGLTPEQYVYVAVERVSGRYKIGISKHPTKRVEDLSRAHPEGLDLVAVYSANESGRLSEKLIHDALDKWRLNGEWFSKDAPMEVVHKHFQVQ
jgi:hypothetical protein